jgi:signal transduction histidine kinase
VSPPADYQREVLRQAEVALQGREVTLWEVSPTAAVAPVASSVSILPDETARLDLGATLKQWGAPFVAGSRWIGCRLEDSGRWCVAPIRSRPPAPPPGGVERRSRERLILELAGLCLGTMDVSVDPRRRLAPADAAREHARQPSVIAHEVGNQLTVAGGNLELGIGAVRAATTLDAAFRSQLLEDLTNAAKGIEQATDYLRAIQNRSGMGAGRVSRFDVAAVVRSCVTLERPLARKRGVALEWESKIDSAYLSGDPNALYQVVTNLIRNAVDASEERQAAVSLVLERAAETLHLTVRDHGVGISRAHLDRVFEAGFTTKPPGAGSGMGLSVVREITANMFGGTVRVESEVGQGSAFTLVLPIPPQRANR